MFCKNCANQINSEAIVCLSCGCDPKRANKHCHNCGGETNAEQVICLKCGVALQNKSQFSDEGKTVAIISYLTLIGFIIALIQHGSNKTRLGAYHLRHVLGFILTGVGLSIFLWVLMLPMFSMNYRNAESYAAFIAVVSFLSFIGLLVCIFISFINAINGLEKPAPLVGKLFDKWFANIFKFGDDEYRVSSGFVQVEKIVVKSSGDIILLLVILWMCLYRFLVLIDPSIFYNSNILLMTNLIWGFIPFGLAFAVKDKSKRIVLLILGGIYFSYDLYIQFFNS